MEHTPDAEDGRVNEAHNRTGINNLQIHKPEFSGSDSVGDHTPVSPPQSPPQKFLIPFENIGVPTNELTPSSSEATYLRLNKSVNEPDASISAEDLPSSPRVLGSPAHFDRLAMPELPPKSDKRFHLNQSLSPVEHFCSICDNVDSMGTSRILLPCGHCAHSHCVDRDKGEMNDVTCHQCVEAELRTPFTSTRSLLPGIVLNEEPRSSGSSIYQDLEEPFNWGDSITLSRISSHEFIPHMSWIFDSCPEKEQQVSADHILAQKYIHYTTPTTAELFLQLDVPNRLDTWHYRSTAEDIENGKKYASVVAWATDLSELSVSSDCMGPVRVHSVFYKPVPGLNLARFGETDVYSSSSLSPTPVKRRQGQLLAYLYERYLVVLKPSDGFEDLHAIFDLEDDNLGIYAEGMQLVITWKGAHMPYKLLAPSEAHLALWISLINDKNLACPCDLDKAISQNPVRYSTEFDAAQCGAIELVLCIPAKFVSLVVPQLLSRLRSQDRLGLVVVSNDESMAYLGLHKPSWSKWKFIVNMEISSLELFTPSHESVINTAKNLFKDLDGRRSALVGQSIVLIAGCPVTSVDFTSKDITVHTVGLGDHDHSLLVEISTQNRNARFQFANSEYELASCVAGICAAEQSVLYRDLTIDLRTAASTQVVGNIGESSVSTNNRTIVELPGGRTLTKLNIGNLCAGQRRTVEFQLNFEASKGPLHVTEDLQVGCTSSLIGSLYNIEPTDLIPNKDPYDSNSLPKALVFGWMTRAIAEILKQCPSLAKTQNWKALNLLLNTAKQTVCDHLERHMAFNGYLDQLSSPVDVELESRKAKMLIDGLFDLQQKLQNTFESGTLNTRGLSILLETQQILETQCSMRGLSLIGQLFFEGMSFNTF